MKKTLLILALLVLPTLAHAATIKVVPTLTNAHGGTATGADLKVCVVQGSFKQCDKDMPIFSIGEGSYEVQFLPPQGYGYEANYYCPSGTQFDFKQQKEVCKGDPDRTITCSGTIGANEDKVCHVTYFDGATITSTPAPIDGTTGGATSNASTQPSIMKSGLTSDQVAAIIGLLEAFGVDPKVVGNVAVILYGR